MDKWGAPDLAVEVVSPSDTYTEVEEKVTLWIQHGTRMVIVVNPRRRSVTVYRSDRPVLFLSEQDELSGDDIVPGWSIRVQDLFRWPPCLDPHTNPRHTRMAAFFISPSCIPSSLPMPYKGSRHGK